MRGTRARARDTLLELIVSVTCDVHLPPTVSGTMGKPPMWIIYARLLTLIDNISNGNSEKSIRTRSIDRPHARVVALKPLRKTFQMNRKHSTQHSAHPSKP